MRMTQITPFIPCTSLARQFSFYRDVLGFEVGYKAENYAFLRRDSVAVRLIEVSDDVVLSHQEREGSLIMSMSRVWARCMSR